MKNILFAAATVILMLISASFVAGTVHSQTAEEALAYERYCETLEEEYVSRIRAYLTEQGFENSGIMLTRIVEEQGEREYQVTLHHKYLEKLSHKEIEDLFETIKGMAFSMGGCVFQVELFV